MQILITPIPRTLSSLLLLTSKLPTFLKSLSSPSLSLRAFSSSSSTPYPLYYDLINYRPAHPFPPHHRPNHRPDPSEHDPDPMDRSERKYYRKRQKRMYGGSDSDDAQSHGDEFIELKPEIVDFPRLHPREEELYFYDAFAYPWEKDKHYRMLYQLEKKYFPEQCLDKAFVDPGTVDLRRRSGGEKGEEKGLVFFDDEAEKDQNAAASAGGDVSEKKVEEFFKCMKKVPGAAGRKGSSVSSMEDGGGEPYLVSRKTELPPRWDGPSGTVVLVDKPKGCFFLF